MRIDDFRKYHLTPTPEPTPTEVKGVVMGSMVKVLGPEVITKSETAGNEETVENSAPQDDLDETYEVDADDFEVLKDCYEFFNKVMQDLLLDQAILTLDRVKEMAGIASEIHMLINEFEVYKPEESGDIKMAASLEEESRDLSIQTPAE